jgi:hypothetical protein
MSATETVVCVQCGASARHRFAWECVEVLRARAQAAEQRAVALEKALIGLAQFGSRDEPLYAWCDAGWTCEHADCRAARIALGVPTGWDQKEPA